VCLTQIMPGEGIEVWQKYHAKQDSAAR
jgi:hypothetical protein